MAGHDGRAVCRSPNEALEAFLFSAYHEWAAVYLIDQSRMVETEMINGQESSCDGN